MAWIGKKMRRRADGSRSESVKFYFRVTVDGHTVERAGSTSLLATRRMAAGVERELLAGVLEPAARLRAVRRTPLEAWVDEHVVHLAANGTGAGQQASVRGHLRMAFGMMGARVLGDVSTAGVEGHLLEMVDTEKRGEPQMNADERRCRTKRMGGNTEKAGGRVKAGNTEGPGMGVNTEGPVSLAVMAGVGDDGERAGECEGGKGNTEGPGVRGRRGPVARMWGLSFKTRNHRLAALKHFFVWARMRGLVGESPVEFIRPLVVERDPGHEGRRRRALTVDEFDKLVAAARVRPLEGWRLTHSRVEGWRVEALELKGLERATVYVVGARAGLRRQELAKLRWEDVRWGKGGGRGELVVRAGASKNGREETVPMFGVVEGALRELMAARNRVHGRWPRGRVFTVVNQGLMDALRKDLAAAGVEGVTADGRVDLHALRTTCGTWLAANGVGPSVAQRLLRHSDPKTTMKFYTRVQEQMLRLEMERVEGGGATSGDVGVEGAR